MAETTDQADIAVVALTEAEDVAVLVVEDLHLGAVAVLIAVEIEETVRCLKPHVVTAEKNVKCLLDLQTVNRFIVVSVLRKWEMEVEVTLQEVILGHKPQSQLRTIPNWKL